MALHSGVKLGKAPAKHDPRNLKLARYAKALFPAPPSFDLSSSISDLGMLMNDQLDDCTCAGIAHMFQAWTCCNGKPFTPTDAAVLDLYEKTCGYNPADPSTDQGGVLLDVLNYVKANNFSGHTIDGFVQVDFTNKLEVMNALYYFGGLYVGAQLPKTAQDQEVWDVPWYGAKLNAKPGSWGGHCIANIASYNEKTLRTITWGAFKDMTWNFLKTYCDEAYAIVSLDWAMNNGKCPTGFDEKTLLADLASVQK